MKIHKVETVVRYGVTFPPSETRILLAHPKWSRLISTKSSTNNGRHPNAKTGAATLTRRQINDICDVLGINGREFMSGKEP